MNKLLTLTLLSVLSSASAAGTLAPFGIPFTATPDDLRKMGGTPDKDSHYWTITSPPQPNAEFEWYRASVTPAGRICSIFGSGRDIVTTQDGAAVRAQFNTLKAALTAKYGPSEDYDQLDDGSRYTGKNDWMTALDKGQRDLDSYWNTDAGSDMPSNISQIYVSALALSSTKGWVNVYYHPTDYEACTEELDALPGDGL